jgi:hypothetical protein
MRHLPMTWQMLLSPRGLNKIVAITTTATLTRSPSNDAHFTYGVASFKPCCIERCGKCSSVNCTSSCSGLLHRLIHLLVADQV